MHYILFCYLFFATSVLADHWRGEDYFHNSSSQKEAASDLLLHIPLSGHQHVLDIGCGDGKITAELAKTLPNSSVLGIDISPSMIAFAKSSFQLPNLRFELKNAEELEYQNVFDLIVSFTTLQWIQDHDRFLQSAYNSLNENGIFAATMPLGLPAMLEQAVTEQIAMPEWQSYFQNFATGWNFIEQDKYAALLSKNGFITTRLAVVPQKDFFPNREIFEKFISQWFPYLRPLPEHLKSLFMKEVIDRFLELDEQTGEVQFKILRLEIVAHRLL